MYSLREIKTAEKAVQEIHPIVIGNPLVLDTSGFSPTPHRACDFHRTRRSIVSKTSQSMTTYHFEKAFIYGLYSCKARFQTQFVDFGKLFLVQITDHQIMLNGLRVYSVYKMKGVLA